jgi:hypothetical protein
MRKFAICIVLGALFAGNALAQNVNAGLGGTVTDASGAVIPGVAVTVTGIETGVETRTITNEAGAYQVPSLNPANTDLCGSGVSGIRG